MFRNARIAIVSAALALSACGSATQPVVTNGDITKHLEGLGYTKVLLPDGTFSCGKAGRGKQFIATKGGKTVHGQVCYRKDGSTVTYKADELTNGKSIKPATNDNKIDGGAEFWKKK